MSKILTLRQATASQLQSRASRSAHTGAQRETSATHNLDKPDRSNVVSFGGGTSAFGYDPVPYAQFSATNNRPSYDTTKIFDLKDLPREGVFSDNGKSRFEKLFLSVDSKLLPKVAVIRSSLSASGQPALIGKTVFVPNEMYESAKAGTDNSKLEDTLLSLSVNHIFSHEDGISGRA